MLKILAVICVFGLPGTAYQKRRVSAGARPEEGWKDGQRAGAHLL